MELALNGQVASFHFVDGHHEGKYFLGEKSLSDHSAEDEPSLTGHREFDIEEFHGSNQRNGHLGHNSGHLFGQKGKQKFERSVFPFKNHKGTELQNIKMDGDKVDEHVLVEGNGHLTCNQMISTHKEGGSENRYSRILPKNISTNMICCNTDKHKIVEDIFNLEVANKDKYETCEQVACCAYLFQDASALAQR